MKTTRKFGAEFEAKGLTTVDAWTAIQIVGVSCEYYGKTHTGPQLSDSWKVVFDSSVSNGFEAVTPPLQDTKDIKTALKALNQAGATIDKTCGFHVHIDAKGMTLKSWKRLGKLWIRIERATDKLLAKSRRENANVFCRSNRDRIGSIEVWDDRFDSCTTAKQVGRFLSGGSRYHKLNTASFPIHGTVEFRAHQGTLNGQKAEIWILFCIQIVELACGNIAIPGSEDLPLDTVLNILFQQKTQKAPKPSTKQTTQRFRTWTLFNAWEDIYNETELKNRVAMETEIWRPGVVREHVAWKQYKNPAITTITKFDNVCNFFKASAVALSA